jgi:hypothetical protein
MEVLGPKCNERSSTLTPELLLLVQGAPVSNHCPLHTLLPVT